LDLFAGLQADCGRQGQGKIDIEPGLLAFGADGLKKIRLEAGALLRIKARRWPALRH